MKTLWAMQTVASRSPATVAVGHKLKARAELEEMRRMSFYAKKVRKAVDECKGTNPLAQIWSLNFEDFSSTWSLTSTKWKICPLVGRRLIIKAQKGLLNKETSYFVFSNLKKFLSILMRSLRQLPFSSVSVLDLCFDQDVWLVGQPLSSSKSRPAAACLTFHQLR